MIFIEFNHNHVEVDKNFDEFHHLKNSYDLIYNNKLLLKEKSNNKLKLSIIDELLKLNYSDYYLLTDKNFLFATDDEKKSIEATLNNKTTPLTSPAKLIKKEINDIKIIITITNQKNEKFYLLSTSDNKNNKYFNIVNFLIQEYIK